MNGRSCLVTGGAGFIGSHLVDALVHLGASVRILDNFSTGDRRNLFQLNGDIEVVEGDLRSFERVLRAMRGCELVFHLAALPSVPRSIQDPLTSSEVNVAGTLNVLLAARDTGVSRIVNSSSSSVYGGSKGDVRREEQAVAPISPYGVSKLAAEAYAKSFYEVYALETVSLRYFNVFGPRQSPVSEYAAVIPSFLSAALLGERPTIFGDGEQSRDFTFVGNVVGANIAAASTLGVAGEVFNIGCGEATSINSLVTRVAAVTGRPLEVRYAESRPGDVRKSLADVTRAREMLNFVPVVGLQEGLELAYDWFRAEPTLLDRVHERRKWIALAS